MFNNAIIINITHSKESENVFEIMFHGSNNDWFTAVFPIVDVDIKEMSEHYIGKDFYETKRKYKGKVYRESDIFG